MDCAPANKFILLQTRTGDLWMEVVAVELGTDGGDAFVSRVTRQAKVGCCQPC